jgi:surfactin synthase thioesterase subunit
MESIELKGRGKRNNESFYNDFDEAVDDIFQSIKNKIVFNEYMIFGHSMGSLLAYELYYRISEENLRQPSHIFFSGHAAPSAKKRGKDLYLLPDNEFMKEVMDLGGTPDEVVNNTELLQFFLPILRNDFRITERHTCIERENKIECGITIFNGNDDDINLEELLLWKNHGNNSVRICNFVGGHFFIKKKKKRIVDIISSTLMETYYAGSRIKHG